VRRRITMKTRNELLDLLRNRYETSDREQKIKILDQFVSLTGYHRKHAVVCSDAIESWNQI
jgi:hypothetical protein